MSNKRKKRCKHHRVMPKVSVMPVCIEYSDEALRVMSQLFGEERIHCIGEEMFMQVCLDETFNSGGRIRWNNLRDPNTPTKYLSIRRCNGNDEGAAVYVFIELADATSFLPEKEVANVH